MSLLEVEGLRVRLRTAGGLVTVVDGVDYQVEQGEVFGVAGESGSGKTISMLALLGLLPEGAEVEGRVRFDGREPARALARRSCATISGRDLAMVFQDPMTSLHPMLTVGRQLTEHVESTSGSDRKQAERAGARAARAGADPRRRAGAPVPTRTSSRAACGSGSRSRSRSPAGRSS